MQINKVDKLVPTVYNELRATYVKVVLRKWKNVGDGPTREKGTSTGGYEAVKETGSFGRTRCDGDPSRRCREVRTLIEREGDA
jgi:hypothetical protein